MTFFNKTDGHDEWLTPPEIIKALGVFDLDPCAPIARPWPTAKHHFSIDDDGFTKKWFGRVWLNPPYGNETGGWLSRLAEHGNGIALVFARTETKTFFNYVWDLAHGILFIKGRLSFYTIDGVVGDFNGGAPSVLISYGKENSVSILNSGIVGMFFHIDPTEQPRQRKLF